jgi:hypothetical protein
MSIVAAALGLLVLASVPSWAQMDLAKVLVGKWKGKYATESRDLRKKGRTVDVERAAHLRTLIIGQVREQDGRWIVGEARYGEPGKGLKPIDAKVEMTSGEANIQFVTPGGNPVKLSLSKEGLLVGTIAVDSKKGSAFRPMELKKVE